MNSSSPFPSSPAAAETDPLRKSVKLALASNKSWLKETRGEGRAAVDRIVECASGRLDNEQKSYSVQLQDECQAIREVLDEARVQLEVLKAAVAKVEAAASIKEATGAEDVVYPARRLAAAAGEVLKCLQSQQEVSSSSHLLPKRTHTVKQ